MLRIHVDRNAGHPATGLRGFDRMLISADLQGELDEAIVEAQTQHWRLWTSSHLGPIGAPTAVLYKSSEQRLTPNRFIERAGRFG
ncbi:MAG TPA: hypothetical protein VKB34_06515 [Povalibacter sp.]|nr:hypothetical protein [Povalibacter sp.]